MDLNLSELAWRNERKVCSADQLVEVSGLTVAQLDDLITTGVIRPVDEHEQPHYFYLEYIYIAKTARRLRQDFELDDHGVALALTLLRRIDELQSELNMARIHRTRHLF